MLYMATSKFNYQNNLEKCNLITKFERDVRDAKRLNHRNWLVKALF